jgi:hypothetical protein
MINFLIKHNWDCGRNCIAAKFCVSAIYQQPSIPARADKKLILNPIGLKNNPDEMFCSMQPENTQPACNCGMLVVILITLLYFAQATDKILKHWQ